jgi:dethiobiotin synthetase
VLAAAIVAALRARGRPVRALKPVITGLDDPPHSSWPPDHRLLARVGGSSPEEVALIGFGPPVSPHLATELCGRAIDPERLVDAVLAAAGNGELLVVEGVGGLLVPLSEGYDVRSLARDLGLRIVIAARPGLGTINHTLLTIEAARRAGLPIAGVVLTPWPERPDRVERSNRATIERLGGVAVSTLPSVQRADPELLAAAASALPLERWLSSPAHPVAELGRPFRPPP